MSTEAIEKETSVRIAGRGEVKLERLPQDHPLIRRLLELYVEDWKREHSADKLARRYFYASDVGRCPRSIYYQFTAPEKKADMKASTIINFTLGNLFHDELQQKLKRLGVVTGLNRMEFGTRSLAGLDFDRRGRIDVQMLEDMIEDQPVAEEVDLNAVFSAPGNIIVRAIAQTPVVLVIGEIKSKNPFGFQTEPDEAEVEQLLVYIADTMADLRFEAEGKKIADYGFIIYMDRGGLSEPPIAIYRVTFSPERIAAINAEFSALQEAIKTRTVPARPYERDSTTCRYCRFQDWCWRNFPKPEPPKLEPDPTVEAPAQEIVESAAASYVELSAKIKELETTQAEASKVLMAYFRAKGEGEIGVAEGHGVRCLPTEETEINEPFLAAHLTKAQWYKVAKVQVGLLRKAVKDGTIDGTMFERAVRKVAGKPRLKIF